MQTKDLDEVTVLRAALLFEKTSRGMDDILVEMTGAPMKVARAALLREERKEHLWSIGLTEKGRIKLQSMGFDVTSHLNLPPLKL